MSLLFWRTCRKNRVDDASNGPRPGGLTGVVKNDIVTVKVSQPWRIPADQVLR